MTLPVDILIARLAAELEAEEASIAAAVAARSIGDGSSYWKRAHFLRRRLAVAVALREALESDTRGTIAP